MFFARPCCLKIACPVETMLCPSLNTFQGTVQHPALAMTTLHASERTCFPLHPGENSPPSVEYEVLWRPCARRHLPKLPLASRGNIGVTTPPAPAAKETCAFTSLRCRLFNECSKPSSSRQNPETLVIPRILVPSRRARRRARHEICFLKRAEILTPCTVL